MDWRIGGDSVACGLDHFIGAQEFIDDASMSEYRMDDARLASFYAVIVEPLGEDGESLVKLF